MTKVTLNIGLVDADRLDNKTRHPNLALMKISSYCKSKSHNVRLIFKEEDISSYENYDIVIISKVFTFTSTPMCLLNKSTAEYSSLNISIKGLLEKYEEGRPEHTQFAIGGTGFFENGGIDLDDEIEHIMPDYNLYDDFINWMVESKGLERSYFDDYENYSIGFMTRGCFRKCPFCVNKKYDKCSFHAHVEEFLDKNRPKIYLWDDNVLACSSWKAIFDELDATGKPFQFRQGLDLRLINDEKAERISKSRSYGDMIFAFDNVDDYNRIDNQLKIWRKHSKKTTKLYVLCGFDSWIDPERVIKNHENHIKKMYSLLDQDSRDQLDIEGIFIRIELLMRYGCLPYIMRHQNYQNSKYRELYVQIARWCNQPQFFKKKSFKEFCIANQDYAKSEKICASYQAYLDFQSERPDIVNRYFDLRFDQMNATKTISSFGREETIPCIYCNHRYGWDQASLNPRKTIIDYYSGQLNQLCILCRPAIPVEKQCTTDENTVGEILYDAIHNTKYADILKGIDLSKDFIVESKHIPQLNQVKLAYMEVIDLIDDEHPLKTFEELGALCTESESGNKESNSKYGECQAKLLMMTDLVWKDREGFHLTPLGRVFQTHTSENERRDVFSKLIFKIPLVQKLIKCSKYDTIRIEDILSDVLSQKTTKRRSEPIRKLIYGLKGLDPELDSRIDRIL